MDIPKKPGIYLSNGKYYQTKNLYKKAKKLHDSSEDKKIILHHYVNNDTGYSITSIFDNLQEEGYIQVD